MMSDVLDDCFQRILLHRTAIRFVATNSFPFNYFKPFSASSPYFTLNYSINSSFILLFIYAVAGGMRY